MNLRSLSLGLFVSLASLALGCASEGAAPAPSTEPAPADDIVDVAHTAVERQAIGNCWLYAEATWAESMHLAATGESFDVSQSYWTYWHWFDQIAFGSGDAISTGGSWSTANDIVLRYGVMSEADFIASDTAAEMSARQKQALDAINKSLTDGVLSDPRTRSNPVAVRAELDAAWGLTKETAGHLTRAFGEDGLRTFRSNATASGTPIIAAADFSVAYAPAPGRALKTFSLAQATRDWRRAFFSPGTQRSFLKRVQSALHDAQPVIITWFVDFNALENDRNAPLPGSFTIDKLNTLGPGSQGGHMTVLEDYQATLADGTVLPAGTTLDKVKDKALLDRALRSDTTIDFLRVKNSWGASRPDKAYAPGMPGYHDLYVDYLSASIKQCREKDGKTDPTDCPWQTVPLQYVVLPPGY